MHQTNLLSDGRVKNGEMGVSQMIINLVLAGNCVVLAIVIVRLNLLTRKLKEHGVLETRRSEL